MSLRAGLAHLGLGVFSAAVWAASLTWMVLVAVAAVALLPVVPFQRSHTWLGAPGMAFCLRLTLSRVTIHYHPRFDPQRRSVFCQNHVSVLDGHVACAAIPHAFCGLMNHWHFWVPGYGWIMRLAQGIPVYPRASGRTSEISTAARGRAAAGLSILTFPEAHRTLDGRVREFRRGVFFMARDAGLPVVPLAVRGLFEVNRKGSWRFRPGHVQVFVGPQEETVGLDDAGVGALAARLQAHIDGYVRTGAWPED